MLKYLVFVGFLISSHAFAVVVPSTTGQPTAGEVNCDFVKKNIKGTKEMPDGEYVMTLKNSRIISVKKLDVSKVCNYPAQPNIKSSLPATPPAATN